MPDVSTYQTPDGVRGPDGQLVRPQGRYNDRIYDSPQQDRVVIDHNAPDMTPQDLVKMLRQTAGEMRGFKESGSTASIAHISKDGMLTVANVGDSPVNVYIRNPQTGEVGALPSMHGDHSASNPSEAAAIQQRGGVVQNGRAGGMLALSRALGDSDIKGISSEAEPSQLNLKSYLNQGYEVIVTVDSDGAFEKGVDNNVRAKTLEHVMNMPGNSNLGEVLARTADYAGATDNISSSVAVLKPGEPITQNIVMGVFDGHGTQGGAAASTAQQSFQKQTEALRAQQRVQVAAAPVTQEARQAASPTLADPQLAAKDLNNWTFEKRNLPANSATPQEMLSRYERNGYKPTSQLTAEEARGLSPERALISSALEEIRTSGDLRSTGYPITVLSDTGTAPAFTMGPLKPQQTPPAAAPVERPATTASQLDWQFASTQNGAAARAPTAGMSEAQIAQAMQGLKADGLNPTRGPSGLLNGADAIGVNGADAMQAVGERRTALASSPTPPKNPQAARRADLGSAPAPSVTADINQRPQFINRDAPRVTAPQGLEMETSALRDAVSKGDVKVGPDGRQITGSKANIQSLADKINKGDMIEVVPIKNHDGTYSLPTSSDHDFNAPRMARVMDALRDDGTLAAAPVRVPQPEPPAPRRGIGRMWDKIEQMASGGSQASPPPQAPESQAAARRATLGSAPAKSVETDLNQRAQYTNPDAPKPARPSSAVGAFDTQTGQPVSIADATRAPSANPPSPPAKGTPQQASAAPVINAPAPAPIIEAPTPPQTPTVGNLALKPDVIPAAAPVTAAAPAGTVTVIPPAPEIRQQAIDARSATPPAQPVVQIDTRQPPAAAPTVSAPQGEILPPQKPATVTPPAAPTITAPQAAPVPGRAALPAAAGGVAGAYAVDEAGRVIHGDVLPPEHSPPAASVPHEPVTIDAPHSPGVMSKLGAAGEIAGHGVAAMGAVQGTIGAIDAYKQGDKTGAAINGANAAVAGASVANGIATSTGRQLLSESAEGMLGKAGVVGGVAVGVYEVVHAKTYDDKVTAGMSTTVTTGAAMATEGLLVGAGASGLAVVAAPVVAAAAVGMAVDHEIKVLKKSEADTKAAVGKMTDQIHADGQLNNYKTGLVDHTGKPNIADYGNLRAFSLDQAKKDGNYDAVANNKVDFSKPETMKKLEDNLNKELASQKAIANAKSDSILPGWMHSADEKQVHAQTEVAQLEEAQKQLQKFKGDLGQFDKDQTVKAAAQEKAKTEAAARQKVIGQETGKLQTALGVEGAKPGHFDTATKDKIGETIAQAQMTPEYKAAMEKSGGKLKQDGGYGAATEKALEAMATRGEIKTEVVAAIAALHHEGGLQYNKVAIAAEPQTVEVKAGPSPVLETQSTPVTAQIDAPAANPPAQDTTRTTGSYSQTIGGLNASSSGTAAGAQTGIDAVKPLTPTFQSAAADTAPVVTPTPTAGPGVVAKQQRTAGMVV